MFPTIYSLYYVNTFSTTRGGGGGGGVQAVGVGGGGVEGKEEGLLCRKRNGSIRFTASLGWLEGCRKKECPPVPKGREKDTG
jgi:hypothetical protein